MALRAIHDDEAAIAASETSGFAALPSIDDDEASIAASETRDALRIFALRRRPNHTHPPCGNCGACPSGFAALPSTNPATSVFKGTPMACQPSMMMKPLSQQAKPSGFAALPSTNPATSVFNGGPMALPAIDDDEAAIAAGETRDALRIFALRRRSNHTHPPCGNCGACPSGFAALPSTNPVQASSREPPWPASHR